MNYLREGGGEELASSKPRHSHAAFTLWVNLPTSPCPTYSISPKDIAGSDVHHEAESIMTSGKGLNLPLLANTAMHRSMIHVQTLNSCT